MQLVKLSVGNPSWRGLRQTPGGAGQWGQVRFALNEDVDECDAWVVLQSTRGLLRKETTRCPPENVILITREPDDIMSWPAIYCRQYAKVITCQRRLSHQHKVLTQHGQVWHFNQKGYDELKALPPVQKRADISVIASDRCVTDGHRTRYQLAKALAGDSKLRSDHYGRGVNPIDDKWDAIAPYRFHVVIENSQHPHYWTEKLTDCYLGYAYPIYWGATNIHEYFPRNALLQVDVRDPRAALFAIREFTATHSYEELLPEITQARNRVLDEYNLFPTLLRHLNLSASLEKHDVTLKPAFEFS